MNFLENIKPNLVNPSLAVEVRKMFINTFESMPSEIIVSLEESRNPTKEGRERLNEVVEKLKKKFNIKEDKSFTRISIPFKKDGGKFFSGVFDMSKDKKNPVIMSFEMSYISIFFKNKIDIIDEIINFIKENKVTSSTKNKIHLISHNQFAGFFLQDFKFDDFDFDIKSHYNDDFIDEHEIIFNNLSNKDSGLVMLHGNPGTGKTFYIRYLTRVLEKKIIYISPNMINKISNEAFIPFLSSNPNTILVLEDAENIIAKRESGDNQSVSNLLNISEGLLGDALKIQLILTFNKGEKEIDEALLRKGRLISKYEFKNLEKDKANKLIKKLGHNKSKFVDKDTSLSNIYGIKGKKYSNKEKAKIGFENK